MKYTLKPIPAGEQRLLFRLAETDPQNENKIGMMRGDFGRTGCEFYYSWFPHNEKLNTQQFTRELTRLVDDLRSENGAQVLQNLSQMRRICQDHPECALKNHWIEGHFGYRIALPQYVFYMKCFPGTGDYHFYLSCYLNAEGGAMDGCSEA